MRDGDQPMTRTSKARPDHASCSRNTRVERGPGVGERGAAILVGDGGAGVQAARDLVQAHAGQPDLALQREQLLECAGVAAAARAVCRTQATGRMPARAATTRTATTSAAVSRRPSC